MPNLESRSIAPLLVALVLACGLLACSPSPSDPAPETASEAAPEAAPTVSLPDDSETAAQAIEAGYQRQVVREISDDRLEGRLPGTPGDAMAREYLIAQLESLGYEPGGADGSWEQPFEIVGVDADLPVEWTFSAGDQDLALSFGDECMAFSGVQDESAAIEDAELVFVGYGIEAPEYDWDDYKGADLAGKVLVMLNNDPDWDDDLFEGNRRLYYGRWTYKYEVAARHGAAGAIVLHTTESAGYPWQVVESSWSGPQFEIPAGDEPRIRIGGWTTWEASEKLFTFAGEDLAALVETAKTREFVPVPLGVRTSLSLRNAVDRGVETANVLGLLRGSDPELAGQVVMYTAHHDHLGRGGDDASGDTIYNGARDNGTGMAVLLSVAKAYKALATPPRRSILFAFVAAEEQGLLGSKYYAANPTFAAGRIAGLINYDSANIWGRTRDVTFIGYGKSSLDQVAEAVARRQNRVVKGDQFPDHGSFYRSDQFSLAKIGVPALYLNSGTDFLADGDGKARMEEWIETRYHQPSDELEDDWSFEAMVEDARFGFFAGLAIAQADEMPAWKPGDEFEAARLEAIAAVQ